MPDVLLSSDELTVLGGPAEISVDLDFGPQGDRGSLIFYGMGKPSEVVIPETPKVYDSYINLLTSDEEYLFMYQYIAGPGGSPSWIKLFKLTPNIYGENVARTFINGSTSFVIPVASILPPDLIGTYQLSDFNIQLNIISSNPVSFGLSVNDATGDSNIPITINAIEYIDGEWVPLTGSKTVQLYITVV